LMPSSPATWARAPPRAAWTLWAQGRATPTS
jgi:hypothetical protein